MLTTESSLNCTSYYYRFRSEFNSKICWKQIFISHFIWYL